MTAPEYIPDMFERNVETRSAYLHGFGRVWFFYDRQTRHARAEMTLDDHQRQAITAQFTDIDGWDEPARKAADQDGTGDLFQH